MSRFGEALCGIVSGGCLYALFAIPTSKPVGTGVASSSAHQQGYAHCLQEHNITIKEEKLDEYN